MTPTQEMVMAMFTIDTISKVKQQFKSGNEIVSNESFDMSFRLFKPTKDYINLELLIQMPVETGQGQNLSRGGYGRTQNTVMFFKPIGFFYQKKDFLTTKIEATVVREFENDLDYLIKVGKIPSNIKVNKLSLEENALIAAFSMEALLNAEKHQDCSFTANGLDMDIFMTYDNQYPQSFLNDKYGVNGHIGAYFLRNGEGRIDMNIKYERLFKRLFEMSLMTAYKRL